MELPPLTQASNDDLRKVVDGLAEDPAQILHWARLSGPPASRDLAYAEKWSGILEAARQREAEMRTPLTDVLIAIAGLVLAFLGYLTLEKPGTVPEKISFGIAITGGIIAAWGFVRALKSRVRYETRVAAISEAQNLIREYS